MGRVRLMAACCAWLLAWGGLAVAMDETVERKRIAAERKEIEAGHLAELTACEARFVVTSCADTAKARRRAALQVLDGQQAQLDDTRRKRRAAERQAALEHRLQAEAAVAAPADPPAPAQAKVRRQPIQLSAPGPEVASAPRTAASRKAKAMPEREAEASRAAARREQDVARHRLEVEARNAARASRKPPAAALPDPAASRP